MPRKDQILTTVILGAPFGPIGAFKTFSGGGAQASSLKSRRAAGQGQVERGGPKTVTNVTVGREDDGTLDLTALSAYISRLRATVVRQPLDDDGNAFGKPRTAAGKLLEVNPGDGDADDSGTLDVFTLVIGCDSTIS